MGRPGAFSREVVPVRRRKRDNTGNLERIPVPSNRNASRFQDAERDLHHIQLARNLKHYLQRAQWRAWSDT
jgi:hypothetical protein